MILILFLLFKLLDAVGIPVRAYVIPMIIALMIFFFVSVIIWIVFVWGGSDAFD